MKLFALSAAVGAVLLGLITPALAKSRGFRLIVTIPSQQTFVPQYLTCAGTLTSTRPTAAVYYFSDTPPFGTLRCQDDGSNGLIGWARASDGGLFAPFGGPEDKAILTKFSVADNNNLVFVSGELGSAKWIVRFRDGRDIVQGYFGGVTTLDYEIVTLTADFEE